MGIGLLDTFITDTVPDDLVRVDGALAAAVADDTIPIDDVFVPGSIVPTDGVCVEIVPAGILPVGVDMITALDDDMPTGGDPVSKDTDDVVVVSFDSTTAKDVGDTNSPEDDVHEELAADGVAESCTVLLDAVLARVIVDTIPIDVDCKDTLPDEADMEDVMLVRFADTVLVNTVPIDKAPNDTAVPVAAVDDIPATNVVVGTILVDINPVTPGLGNAVIVELRPVDDTAEVDRVLTEAVNVEVARCNDGQVTSVPGRDVLIDGALNDTVV